MMDRFLLSSPVPSSPLSRALIALLLALIALCYPIGRTDRSIPPKSSMNNGLVCTQGYPIGNLYMAVRAHAAETGDDVRSLDFKSRREMLLSLGVPECRIMSVVPQLLVSPFTPEMYGLPTDYDMGLNLPEEL